MSRTKSPLLVALLLAAIVVGGAIGAAAARAARPTPASGPHARGALPLPGLDRVVSRLATEARAH